MAPDLIVNCLMRLPLFQGLTVLQLGAIAAKAEAAQFHPGAVITEQNADADAAILIVAGEAVRVSGPELKTRLEAIPPGSLISESAMLVDTTYGSTVVARSHVSAVRILREHLTAQIEKDHSIADWLLRVLSGRLNRMAEELREIDTVLAGRPAQSSPPPRPILDLPAPLN